MTRIICTLSYVIHAKSSNNVTNARIKAWKLLKYGIMLAPQQIASKFHAS